MGSSGMNDRSRGSQSNNVGKGFGAGKASWNSNIWGDSNLGGFGDGKLSPAIEIKIKLY
jgi:mRNA-binding protein PUF3